MPKAALDRRVLLNSEQKTEAAELRAMGFTRSQAWRRVLTPKQRQVFYEQIRTRSDFAI
jgi:Spy/CpxP family protein refolding chaperone